MTVGISPALERKISGVSPVQALHEALLALEEGRYGDFLGDVVFTQLNNEGPAVRVAWTLELKRRLGSNELPAAMSPEGWRLHVIKEWVRMFCPELAGDGS